MGEGETSHNARTSRFGQAEDLGVVSGFVFGPLWIHFH